MGGQGPPKVPHPERGKHPPLQPLLTPPSGAFGSVPPQVPWAGGLAPVAAQGPLPPTLLKGSHRQGQEDTGDTTGDTGGSKGPVLCREGWVRRGELPQTQNRCWQQN